MSVSTISSTAAISSIQTPRKFAGPLPLVFLRNRLNMLEVSSSGLSFPCECNARAPRRPKFSFYGFRVLSTIVKHLTERFFKIGSGKTVSLQPMGTSLRNAAKTVIFDSL